MACGSKEQKVTTMVLKVDLDCCQCYRKVKKTLCKFPQIRNQVYDEKNNAVFITVVCCSPEKIRDKLCCKAGKSIKSIEIKENKPKPDPAPAPAPAPAPDDKPKPKPDPAPADPPKPKPDPAPAPTDTPKPKPAPEPEKPKTAPAPEHKPPEKIQKNGSKNGSKNGGSKPAAEPAPKPAEPAPKPAEPAPKPPAPAPAPPKPQEPEAQWVPGYPPVGPPPQTVIPVSMCCTPCYEGRPGGPCYGPGPGPVYPNYGYYGRPCPPPPPCYGPSRCDYFSEENPAACSIM